MVVSNTIYVAGKYESRARILNDVTPLAQAGLTITSRWLHDTGPRERPREELMQVLARNVMDMAHSACLILDTLDEDQYGGREAEFSSFAANKGADNVMIVGPVRNIYHHIAKVRCASWADVARLAQVAMGQLQTSDLGASFLRRVHVRGA